MFSYRFYDDFIRWMWLIHLYHYVARPRMFAWPCLRPLLVHKIAGMNAYSSAGRLKKGTHMRTVHIRCGRPCFTPNMSYRYIWVVYREMGWTSYDDSALIIIDGDLTAVGAECHNHRMRYSYHTNELFTLQDEHWVDKLHPMQKQCFNAAVVRTSDVEHKLKL